MKKLQKIKIAQVMQYFFAAIFLFTMALLLECSVFQFSTIVHKSKPVQFSTASAGIGRKTRDILVKLTEEEQESIRINQENQKMLAKHYGEEFDDSLPEGYISKNDEIYQEIKETTISFKLTKPYYAKKVKVTLPLEEKGGYSFRVTDENGEMIETFYASIDPRIDTGYASVSKTIQYGEIVFLSAEDIEEYNIAVEISNMFQINWLRLSFFFILFFMIALLIKCRTFLTEKMEYGFAIFAFFLGGFMIMGVSTNQVGYDEYAHAKTAYDLSFSTVIETTESAMQLKGNLLPTFYSQDERKLIEKYLEANHDFSWADITYQSKIVRSENRVYYPNALGFKFARMINADFATSVQLAKFGGLITYILVMMLAIKFAKGYQLILLLIGLLPNNIFMACSLTRDMVVTSFIILGSVLMMNEFLNRSKKLNVPTTLGILLCFAIGSVSKPVYIVMILLLLFLSKNKFNSRIQEVIFKIAIIAVVGLMLYDIVKPTPVASNNYQLVSNIAYQGDKRSSGTSVSGQIGYILGNPLAYSLVLLKEMVYMPFEYIVGLDSFLDYGYLGSAPYFVNLIVLAMAIYISIFKPKECEREQLTKPILVLNCLMIFGTCAVLWTSMYVSFTAVSANRIEGVQGRYFIPLAVSFFMCFFSSKRQSPFSKKTTATIVYSIMAAINLLMLYSLVLLPMNL